MNNTNSLLRFTLCLCIMLFASICFSQEEYEYVNTSSWRWSYNQELSFNNNTADKLLVANNHAESSENQKNNIWSWQTTWLEIPVLKGSSYTITFSIKNEHNPKLYKYKVMGVDKKGKPKEMWHDTDIYWGLTFQCNDNYGKKQEFDQNYCNRRKMNNSYTYTTSNNSDSKTWRANEDIDTRTFKVEYDGISTLRIYGGYGSTLVKTFYNTDGLRWIGVRCGCAAQILMTNLKMYRQTAFGTALPTIIEASELIDKKEYSKAISKLTQVLNSYKGSLPYYYRARAYIGQEYYKSAIEDCNSALQYKCETELMNNIYFLRGFSKLLLNDDSGVTDMRQAGTLGMTFLRENDLLNYEPGKSNKASSSKNNTSKRSKSGTINRSSNHVPTLKKTK